MIVYQVVCSSSWAGWAQWSGLWGGYPNIQKIFFGLHVVGFSIHTERSNGKKSTSLLWEGMFIVLPLPASS